MTRKPYFGLRGRALNRAIAALAGTGFLLFGYDQGVMGGLLTLPTFLSTFPEMDAVNTTGAEKAHNSRIQGVSIAIYEIGCMAGALSTLYFGDKLGRRKVIFFGAIIMAVGAILQAAAYGLAQLIVGRIVSGVGNGLITATVPTYQSECAKAEDRGFFAIFEGAMITAGICVSYWIDFAFYFVAGEASWRVPIAFQLVFCLILCTFIFGLPESPRWLAKKGWDDKAREVFAALGDQHPDDDEVVLQVEVIRATLPLVEGGSLRDVFTYGKLKNFHRTCLGIFAQMMQQTSGINLITYYAATVFETSIGLSPLNSRILAAANGTEYFLASWIPIHLIERVGRRKLMIFGAYGMAASMAILAGTVYSATPSDAIERGTSPYRGLGNSGAGIAAAVFLFVFNTFFAIGWLSTTWLYPAEITPLRIRAPANGLSTASNWIMITPVCFESIGYYTYAIFAVVNFIQAFVVMGLFPETAGRSLEEIDLIFEDANPKTPWDVVRIAKELPRQSDLSDDEKGANLSAEAKYALRVRERKGFTASEKGVAQHFEHLDGSARRFEDGPPAEK